MNINDITYEVRGAIFSVFRELGPGLFETVYEAALSYKLIQRGLQMRTQVNIPAYYKDVKLEIGFRADIIVNSSVIIEVKSIETLHSVHKKQLLTYLRLSGLKVGILVNFNVDSLIDKGSIVRIIN
ncbi:GxxExxY protein [Niabella yanshanensis]|uniref:GxxExxY protein n=1 Tax=Niabella yanshanensis TaxID=577386 RepID=A0ABZ0WCP3_9BACT|nr:GxxExxY protein [Niabella yanshanensis]WQD40245.1 GxxExxY protein [Niabella yanshanensis]